MSATGPLWRRVTLTLALLALVRVLTHIPAPGVDAAVVRACTPAGGGWTSLVNLVSGGALHQLSLLAVGVMPYVTASLSVQLLSSAVPALNRLKTSGASGAARLTRMTRALTLLLAAVQAWALVGTAAFSPATLFPGCHAPLLHETSLEARAMVAMAFVAGSAVTLWLGEQITARGIGNGVSLLLMTAMLAGLPAQLLVLAQHGGGLVAVVLVALVATVVLACHVESASVQVPLLYSTKAGGAGGTYFPVKVNPAGVVPVILAAASLSALHAASSALAGPSSWVAQQMAAAHTPLGAATYLLLVVAGTYGFLLVTVKPDQLSDSLAASGAFVPGLAPGSATSTYLDGIYTRLAGAGALYLCALAALPLAMFAATNGRLSMPLGGTGVLIVVVVATETVRAAQLARASASPPALIPTRSS